MDINKANAIVDRLNAVFSGSSADIPTASEIWQAIGVFNKEVSAADIEPLDAPSGIKPSTMHIDGKTVEAVESIRQRANNVKIANESKKKLDEQLKNHENLGKRLKI